ncbi:MAG: GNAT family N-acetyltransferase [Caldilineaceae bacterium]
MPEATFRKLVKFMVTTLPAHAQPLFAFLNQNPLKNIVLLKMLAAYSADCQCFYTEQGTGKGVLLLLPTPVVPYDRHTYPSTQYLVLLSTTGPAMTEALLPFIPHNCKLICKLMDAHDQTVLRQVFQLQRTTAFISYTAANGSQFTADAEVCVSTQPDDACWAIYGSQGHERASMQPLFAMQQAIAFACYAGATPLSVCFAYQNYAAIWEIGSVYTVENARRQGYARRIVQTALHVLLAQQRIPRYQVHEQNAPSLALAEALSLHRFLTMEHFLAEAKW